MDPRINFAVLCLVYLRRDCSSVILSQPTKPQREKLHRILQDRSNFLTATHDEFYDLTHHLVSISMDGLWMLGLDFVRLWKSCGFFGVTNVGVIRVLGE